MGITKNIDSASQSRKWEWLVFLRVALGLLLVFKGISFISHARELENMIVNTNLRRIDQFAAFLSFYITVAHLLGGVLLIAGLYTRVAAALQIPILLGAVIFVNRPGILSVEPEFVLSSIILILLILFLIHGGGAFSMDRYVKRHQL